MPDPPNNAKNGAGNKKVETPPDTMRAVGVPAKFFDYGGDEHEKPGREDSRTKGKFFHQHKLFRTATQQ